MLSYLLGKLHVSKTNIQAIKYVMTKLDKKAFYSMPVEHRKKFYKEIIRIHENNFKTFYQVMTGSFQCL